MIHAIAIFMLVFILSAIAAAIGLLATAHNAPVMIFLSGMVAGIALIMYLAKFGSKVK